MEVDRTEIRLLELLPALASGKPIQCKIHHSFLEDVPTYSAISYCWGDTNKTAPIYICDCEIQVTINLKDALQHLRHTDTSRFLWVDALCINQTNVYERNQQVRIMRDIYRNSTITLVWLGKPENAEKKYFNLAARSQRQSRMTTSAVNRMQTRNCNEPRAGFFFFSKDDGLDLITLLYNPWFERIWVVQEVAVSPVVLVCLGQETITWQAFCSAQNSLDGMVESLLPYALSSRLSPFNQAREDYSKLFEHRLLHLLVTYRHFAASDPRDKIYALAGLSENWPLALSPDYTINIRKIYIIAATTILKLEQNLDILDVPRSHCVESSQDLGLPTWVPDWRFPGSVPSINIRYKDLYDFNSFPGISYRFNACNNRPYKTQTDYNEKRLAVEGYSIGCIQRLSDTWAVYGAFADRAWHILDLVGQGSKKINQIERWISVVGIKPIDLRSGSLLGNDIVDSVLQAMTTAEYAQPEKIQSLLFVSTSYRRAFYKHISRLELLSRAPMGTIFMKSLTDFLYLPWVPHQLSALVNWFCARMFCISEEAVQYEKVLNTTCIGHRIAHLTSEKICLVPDTAEASDHIFLLKGSVAPIVLQPRGSDWEHIGSAYVPGVMYGEIWDDSKCENMWIV
jgi:hypothetical protein